MISTMAVSTSSWKADLLLRRVCSETRSGRSLVGLVATKLKCLCLRKVDMSVRLGETEPGAAVRRPSDRSADNPGGPAWGGVGRPAPNDPRGLSSGQTSGSSAGARPDPPTGLVGRPAAL